MSELIVKLIIIYYNVVDSKECSHNLFTVPDCFSRSHSKLFTFEDLAFVAEILVVEESCEASVGINEKEENNNLSSGGNSEYSDFSQSNEEIIYILVAGSKKHTKIMDNIICRYLS